MLNSDINSIFNKNEKPLFSPSVRWQYLNIDKSLQGNGIHKWSCEWTYQDFTESSKL
jgi:hypothetical protein